MKCPKCGLENRPDARFCKQCGQALPQCGQALPQCGQALPQCGQALPQCGQALPQCGQSLPTQQAVPPTHPTTICPACGATAKLEARFCPRCGKPLPPDPTQPSSSVADTIPAMPSIPQPYATPPPPPVYAQPPIQPPPPSAPAAPRRSFPRWVRWTAAIIAFVCVAVLVVAAITFGPQLLGSEKEPAATPTPIASPTVETPPTELSTPASKATPTPTSEAAPTFDAQVAITASATELHVGDPLTVTIIITNTGQVTFGSLRYQLLGEWEPFLGAPTGAVAGHEVDVPPAGSDTVTFILEAMQPGTAQIHADVTVDTREESPSTRPVSSEYVVEVSIIQ